MDETQENQASENSQTVTEENQASETAQIQQTSTSEVQESQPVSQNVSAQETENAQPTAASVPAEQAPLAPAQTAALVEQAPVATQTTAASTVPFPDQDFTGYIKWVEQNGSHSQKEVLRVLSDYADKMSPRRMVSEDEGAKMQHRLLSVLQTVLNNAPANEFKAAWNTVLAFYQQYQNECFGPLYVNRFAHAWAHSLTDLNALQRLNNLIMLTCNPKNRAVGLKQVDLDTTTSEGFTPLARQRIMEFYQL